MLVLVVKTNKRLRVFFLYLAPTGEFLFGGSISSIIIYLNFCDFRIMRHPIGQKSLLQYLVLKINKASDNKGEKKIINALKKYAKTMHFTCIPKKKTFKLIQQNSITHINNQVVNFDEVKVWLLICLELSSSNLLPIMWRLKKPFILF